MSTAPHSLAARVVAIAVAVAIGMLSVVQSRINGQLGLEIGGFVAAVVSFGSGLLVVGFVLLASRRGRAGLGRVRDALRSGAIPWWMAAGGAAGAMFVLTQSLTVGLLGVALFTISTVGGQVVSALLIDRRGIGSAPPRPPTAFRIAGAALALVAVAWALSTRLQTGVPLWMLVLPVIAGAGIAWQQAVNGQIRLTADSALTATFANFAVGTTLLVIAAAAALPFIGWSGSFPTDPVLYLGGAIGLVFIAASTVIVRITGVLVLGLGAICGQLAMSVALDAFVPVPGHELEFSTVGGAVLALIAVAVAAIRPRRRERVPITESSGSPSD
jgi:transporter family-2 protein